MACRGHSRSQRAASAQVVRIKMRLYPGEDDDLIAFVASIPHRLRAAMVKRALRLGIPEPTAPPTADDDELLAALDALVE